MAWTVASLGAGAVGCIQAPEPGTLSGGEGGATPPPGSGAGGQGGGSGAGGSSQPSTGVTIKLDGGSGGAMVVPEDTAPPLPTGDANCGSATSTTVRQPADVLLVLDRSLSMNYSTSGTSNCSPTATGCVARWPALLDAVDSTLSNATGVQWGLKLFTSPNGSACTVNPGVEVPIGSATVDDIKSNIAGTSPANNTPTAQAIEAATDYLKTVDDTNARYILLATDGEPNCAPGKSSGTRNVDGTVDAIAAAKAAGFPVYVVGIGPSVGNLDNFAQAGGTDRYYPASSPESLTEAFASISKLVATCTFTSATSPPDPDNIAVYLNKQLVTKDDPDGWSFGADTRSIELRGTSCQQATSGASATVEILFGCPGGPPPPTFIP